MTETTTVPVEATEAMLDAGNEVLDSVELYWMTPRAIWAAMLRAAPSAAPRESLPPITDAPIAGQRYQHRKGGIYTVIGAGRMQAENWCHFISEANIQPVDMASVVVYQSEADGEIWVRPVAEFIDGRFVLLPAAAREAGETDAGREALPLTRTLDRYFNCTPEAVAGGSLAQMQWFVRDAKVDIATLATMLAARAAEVERLTARATAAEAEVAALKARLETAAEDERDRLYDLVNGEVELFGHYESKEARYFISLNGGMRSADRAALRKGGA